MTAVEAGCVALVIAGAALRALAPGAREWTAAAPLVFLSALVAEDSCVRLYGFYSYAPDWVLVADRTPLVVPAVWVFVVLSARDVARVVAPRAILATSFALIGYDASLIEPVATNAGLWSWTVDGPFRVPYVGTLGWALFGSSALFWLGRLEGKARWLLPVLVPATTHALLLASWWGLLRWVGRSEPASAAAVPVAAWAVAILAAGVALATGRAGSVPLAIVAPRVPPAMFVYGLLAYHHPTVALATYAASFAVPWVTATRWSRAPRDASRLDEPRRRALGM